MHQRVVRLRVTQRMQSACPSRFARMVTRFDYGAGPTLRCPEKDVHGTDCRVVGRALLERYCQLGAPPEVRIESLFWHPVDSTARHFVEAFDVALEAAARFARGEPYEPPRWFTVEALD